MTTVVESNGYNQTTAYAGSTVFNGMLIHTTGSLPSGAQLTKVTKSATPSNANACQLRASDGTTVLATGSAWSSDTSTFSYTLSANTDYYVGFVGDGSASSFAWQNVTSFPIAGTYLNWTASIGTFSTSYPINIRSVDITYTTDINITPTALNISTSEPVPIYSDTIFMSALNMVSFSPGVTEDYPRARSYVTVGTGTAGTRFVDKNYPVVEGLTAGTTKQTQNPNL